MKYALIGIVAFIIVVYAYTFIKNRKRKNNKIDTVKEFRRKYLNKTPQENPDIPPGYTRYLTKYNSSVDFVEKSEFIKEAKEPAPKQKNR